MSTSVDTRLVQMRFDNKDFTDKIAGTLKSLDDLEKALQLKGCDAGFEKITAAMNDVSFKGIESSLEHLTDTFSIKGAAILTIVSKFTSQIYDTIMGKLKVIPNFITEAIFQGGKKRSENTENAKFLIDNILGVDKLKQKSEKDLTKIEKNIIKTGSAWEYYKGAFNNAVTDTAYGLDQAAKAGSNLIAAGMRDANQIEKALLTVAGIAATANTDYDRVAGYFTKMKSLGKFTGDISNSLTQLGIPAEDVVYKAWKKTTKSSKKGKDEFKKQMSKGKISYDLAAKALEAEYAAAAKKANETYDGAYSNLRAAFARIGQKFYTPLREDLRKFFLVIKDLVNAINNAIDPAVTRFTNVITELFTSFDEGMDNNNGVWYNLVELIRTTAATFAYCAEAIKPFIEQLFSAKVLITALKVPIAVINYLAQLLASICEALGASAESLGSDLYVLFNGLSSYINRLALYFDDSWRALSRIFANLLVGVRNIVTSMIKILGALFEGFVGKLKDDNISKFVNKIADLTELIPKLTDRLIPSEKSMEHLKTIGKGLSDVFGIILDIISILIPNFGKLDLDLANVQEGFFGFIASIAKGISWLRDYLKNNEKFQKAITKVKDVLTKLKKILSDFKTKLSGLWKKVFGEYTVLEVIGGMFLFLYEKAKLALNYLYEQFVKLTGKTPKEVFNSIIDFLKNFPENFNNFWKSITGEDFSDWIKDKGQKILVFFSNLKDKISDVVEKARTETLPAIGQNIKDFFQSIKDGTADDKILEWVINAFTKIGEFFKSIADGSFDIELVKEKLGGLGEGMLTFIGNIFKGIKDFIDKLPEFKKDADEKIENAIKFLEKWLPVIMMAFIQITSQIVKMRLSKAVATFTSAMKSAADAYKNQAMGVTLQQLTKFLITMIVGIVVIVAAIYLFNKMLSKSGNHVKEAVIIIGIILGALIAIMVIMLVALSKMIKGREDKEMLSSINKLADAFAAIFASIAVIMAAVLGIAYAFSTMDSNQIDSTTEIVKVIFIALGIIIVVIAGAMAYLAKTTNALDVKEAGEAMLGIAAIVAAIGVAVFFIAAALKLLVGVAGNENFAKAAITLGVIMAIIVGLVAAILITLVKITKTVSWDSLAKTGSILTAIGIALGGFIVAATIIIGILIGITEYGKDLMPAVSIFLIVTIAILAVVAIIGVIASSLSSLGNVTSILPIMIALSAVMLVFAATVWIIAQSILTLADVPTDKMNDILFSLGVFMIAMLAAIAILAAVGAGTGGTFTGILLATAVSLMAVGAAVCLLGAAILMVAQAFKIMVETTIKLVSWFVTFFEMLTPERTNLVIKNMVYFVTRLLAALILLLPGFTKFIRKLMQEAKKLIPDLLDLIFTFLEDFWDRLLKFLSNLLNSIKDWIDNNIEAIKSIIGTLLDAIITLFYGRLTTFFIALLGYIESQFEPIANLISELLDVLADHAEDWTTSLVEIVYGVLIGVLNGLSDKLPDLLEAIYNFIIAILDGLANILNKDKAKEFKSHIKKTTDAIIGFFKELFGFTNVLKSPLFSIGKELMNMLVDGMSTQIKKLKDPITNVGKTVLEIFKRSLDEHSPSKATFKMGEYLSEGLRNGITAAATKVYNAADSVGSDTLMTLEDALSKVPEILENNVDMNPTITPVLDLSDIIDKSTLLDDLLSSDEAIKISSSEGLKGLADSFDEEVVGSALGSTGNLYFTQNNYSPKSLSRTEIYRDTKNLISTQGKALV